jgi:hypothetical protein
MLGEGGEVVTRQPYRKVWLDHLLSKVYDTEFRGNSEFHARGLFSSCYLMFKERRREPSGRLGL